MREYKITEKDYEADGGYEEESLPPSSPLMDVDSPTRMAALRRARARGTGPVSASMKEQLTNELISKIKHLVDSEYSKSYQKMFEAFDPNHQGVGKDEIKSLFKKLNFDHGWLNSIAAGEIIKTIDSNKDGRIEWTEFEAWIKKQ